jgi:NAD(P)H-flavin reductase
MTAFAPQPPTNDPWLPHLATIRSIENELPLANNTTVFTLELELQPGHYAQNYRFLPGQFNMLYLPGAGEVAISHCGPHESNSALACNDLPQGSFRHTIRAVGRVTNAIAQLKPGDSIGIRGPFGSPWPIEELCGHDVLILAGGLGIAPLRPVIYAIANHRNRFNDVCVLYGSRNPSTILYHKELSSWKKFDIQVETTVDQPQAPPPAQSQPQSPNEQPPKDTLSETIEANTWNQAIGPVTLLLDRRLSRSLYPSFQPANTRVLICGPEIMMHYCAQSARKLGIAPNSIWISMERNMQCGVGYCGHCQWGPFFLCKDGPVLRYDLAEPFLNIKDL